MKLRSNIRNIHGYFNRKYIAFAVETGLHKILLKLHCRTT